MDRVDAMDKMNEIGHASWFLVHYSITPLTKDADKVERERNSKFHEAFLLHS
jgi:hypothetical protein